MHECLGAARCGHVAHPAEGVQLPEGVLRDVPLLAREREAVRDDGLGGVPDLLGRLLADAALDALGVAVDIVFRPEIAVGERIAEVTEFRCKPLGGGADCLADRLGEPLVPGSPECGLVRDGIKAERRDEKRILAEISVECGFVAPAVQTAEDVRPEDASEVDRVPFGVIVLVEQREPRVDLK